MTIDDYKELMKFHLLLADEDLNDFTHAAVDSDGSLWVYDGAPAVGIEIWDNSDGILADSIAKLPVTTDWKDTLMEL